MDQIPLCLGDAWNQRFRDESPPKSYVLKDLAAKTITGSCARPTPPFVPVPRECKPELSKNATCEEQVPCCVRDFGCGPPLPSRPQCASTHIALNSGKNGTLPVRGKILCGVKELERSERHWGLGHPPTKHFSGSQIPLFNRRGRVPPNAVERTV